MTERRCISCYDLLVEADAKVLFADAQPVAWVHPTCLEDYTTEVDQGIDDGGIDRTLQELSPKPAQHDGGKP
jgi:hypothetical protein